MHKGHRTLIQLSLVESHTFDLLRKFVLYTWRSRVSVSAAPKVLKVMACNLHHSKDTD